MRIVVAVVVGIVALVSLSGSSRLPRAYAEKADLDRAGLLATATHVVVGSITAIYERTTREGAWRVTKHVAEVRVEAVEKGEGPAAGTPLYARYWTRSWVGPGTQPPSTSGHRGLPREGERLRIYLARNAYDGFSSDNQDGGFNVLGANGFERVPAAGAR